MHFDFLGGKHNSRGQTKSAPLQTTECALHTDISMADFSETAKKNAPFPGVHKQRRALVDVHDTHMSL